MSDNAKLALIRALLAKAEATEFEAEAESFRAKAFELMAQYGVEEAMINNLKPEGAKEAVESRRVVVDGRYALPKARFLQKIVVAMRGRAIRLVSERGASSQVIQVFGFPSDLDRAELLWTSLCLQMYTMVNHAVVPYYESPRGYRNGLVAGFIETVGQRVKEREAKTRDEAEDASASDTVSVALVLFDRDSAVERAYETAYPRTKSSSSSFGLGSGGYYEGQAHGRKANLGGTGLGRASQTAIGR